MPNIKFNYFYRDGANYKNYGSVVFANPEDAELSTIEKLIQSKLIDDTWFYADQWRLPELFPIYSDFKIDPTWHEFEDVAYTTEKPNGGRSLTEFISIVRQL